ncbi:hypothetical protein NS274_21980 [Pseudomonas oryzihabitans]|nr:hypothetical protein NS274_21980 [Pseudomonas psychrotolerans]KTT38600.1 hypothetical protein SB5_15260 [Pseudomonas psychrotolerans]KTT47159.1 hypothetical protein RSA46_00315 [Pseudomonas psychrotolerans]KTT65200.1 hypothetical protein NS383_11725 [Pseudomonas psychrotolerans]
MTFSVEWEQRYAANTHLSVWPWSDVVSLTRRHCPALGPASRILELGCGAGANIPFFLQLAADYHGLDGSSTMIAHLRERFPQLEQQLLVGDFTEAWPLAPGFDLILDRASLTHNTTAAIRHCLVQVLAALRPGGLFIGVDWFSTAHSEVAHGQPDADAHTRTGYTSGPFAGVGRVHFADEAHLRELFTGFELLHLEEKHARRLEPADGRCIATWSLVARKSDKERS